MNFSTLLTEAHASGGVPATGDVLAVGLPLLRQLQDLHAEGMVSNLGGLAHVTYQRGGLGFDPHMVKQPKVADEAVFSRNPQSSAAGIVVSERLATHDPGTGRITATSRDVLTDPDQIPDRPVMVIGYRAWEQLVSHHDQLTDIHLAGLLLVSYATAIDLDTEDGINALTADRRHLLRLNPHLHPVVAGVLSDMVDPDRTRRPTDLASVIVRLENHRDLPADLDLDAAYQSAPSPEHWRPSVLGHLRERVFDLTRRNRAIYFKPTASTVGLTESSVPMMLDVQRIRPEELLTWNDDVAAEFAKEKPVNLGKWCRFEESPHVPPALDKLITTERRMRAEFGFGRLRLIIAFLRWTDPETNEVVNSPLLFLSAELSRRKGIKPVYQLEVEGEAEVNPDLRHLLNVRFGITLPPAIDPSPGSIRDLVTRLEQAVQATDPAVRIEVVDKPRIRLIRQRAKLRLDAFRRRRATSLANTGRWRRQEHSYRPDDWRPLGLALYRRFVASPELPLRQLTDAAPRPRNPELFAAEEAGAVREREVYSKNTADVSRHRWEVDLCAVTVASIGSKRTSLVRDYDDLLAGGVGAHPPFDQLFSPEPRQRVSDRVAAIGTDQLLVLPADDAQARAVRRAVRGDSFIIQGPPGTGKSQTITNLIASLVAANKRVLFVCEKRAALDVVANRLDQVGLGHLSATIHDSQLDRREFIGNLGATYEAWTGDDETDPEPERADIVARMNSDLARLEAMDADLGSTAPAGFGGPSGPGTGLAGSPAPAVSLRTLIELTTAHRQADVGLIAPDPDPGTAGQGLDHPAAAEWLAARDRLDAVATALTEIGQPSTFAAHPALRLAPQALGDPAHHGGVVAQASAAATRVANATGALAAAGITIDVVQVSEIAALARDAVALAQLPSAARVLNPTGPEAAALTADTQRHAAASSAVSATAEVMGRWNQPLSLLDARTALDVAKQREGSFFSRFNGQWRDVSSRIEQAYRFDAHQIRPSVTQVLTELVAHLDAIETLRSTEAELHQRWGTPHPAQITSVAQTIAQGPLARFVSSPGFDPMTAATAAGEIEVLIPFLLVRPSTTIGQLHQWALSGTAIAPSMEGPLLRWRELTSANRSGPVSTSVLLAALTPGVELPAIERTILEAELDRLTTSGRLAGLSSTELAQIMERLADNNARLLTLTAKTVAHRARKRFAEHLDLAEASMAGRSDDDKAFKRSYNAGRKVLENEFRKKIRHKSIRELADGEPGLVVADLAPIWLMSPLSVSETLPLDAELFDTVVFDEASQIPVEDAVPTVFRAPQVIVVGDRMQLPPTRFFSAETDDDSELIVDAEGHNLLLSLDADSFLTQSDLTLESTLLNWHYRSRYESLIAYSNAAFYDAGLATVPDRILASGPLPPIEVDDAPQGRLNATEVLARPISFHRITNGRYRDRRNEAEADYIAELVRGLLLGESNVTIGVVAFSEAQQGQIEAALAELATLDSAFGAALEAEQERSDGDEYVGLFVKNLENVQGDERDVIIMSVCYGPGPDNKMRMNFGPINQSGGERRLNVIFSRAKHHMAIVSSIDGTAITNTHNPGAAHLARFLTYAAAESIGDDVASAAALRALEPRTGTRVTAADVTAVTSTLAEGLRARGLEVDTGVGRSDFRLDLAVRGDNAYRLGVIIDPSTDPDTSAPRRFVAEAGVLSAFGWPIHRVMITDWWSDAEAVLDRVADAAAPDDAPDEAPEDPEGPESG